MAARDLRGDGGFRTRELAALGAKILSWGSNGSGCVLILMNHDAIDSRVRVTTSHSKNLYAARDAGVSVGRKCNSSSAINDVTVGVDADLMVHPTHAADFRHVPHLTESFIVAL